MHQRVTKIIAVLFIVLFLVALYYWNNGGLVSEEVKELKKVEVRSYQGEDLSSIADFRENSIKGPQFVDKESYRLEIYGLTGGQKSLTYDDVVKNQSYKKVVRLDCVEGWSATILWEGILFKDLAERSQVPEEFNTVIFRAYDGYSTSFPIDYLYDHNIMIAYKMNDVVLPPERGFPFQLVAESKYGYKWIKWITEIEFSADESYRGYWESRGYSNDGSLEKGFFED